MLLYSSCHCEVILWGKTNFDRWTWPLIAWGNRGPSVITNLNRTISYTWPRQSCPERQYALYCVTYEVSSRSMWWYLVSEITNIQKSPSEINWKGGLIYVWSATMFHRSNVGSCIKAQIICSVNITRSKYIESLSFIWKFFDVHVPDDCRCQINYVILLGYCRNLYLLMHHCYFGIFMFRRCTLDSSMINVSVMHLNMIIDF